MKKINKTLIIVLILAANTIVFLPSPAFAAPSKCTNSSTSGIQNCLKTNPIVHDLNLIVGFLSALFGVIVVGSLIFAGIQYTTAGADAGRVSAAKKRITNSLIALVAFICIVAFLQWIIPGGVLN